MGRSVMAEPEIEVDRKRPVNFSLAGQRGIPVTIHGAPAIAVFQDAEWAKVTIMIATIQAKRPDYTDEDAIVWATRRAIEDGRLQGGVVRIGREHV